MRVVLNNMEVQTLLHELWTVPATFRAQGPQAVHSLDVKLSSHAVSSGKAASKRLLATDLRPDGILSCSSRVLISAFLPAVGSMDLFFRGRPLGRLTILPSTTWGVAL
jgi:hypothetical protein